jgi:hypothetical protein
MYGTKADFGIMPQYKSLLPLLQIQPYICTAFTIDDWICTGSPCGDQPWQPPKRIEEHYEHVHHLTYRRHPYGNESLIDFIAWQQGLKLNEPVVPFIIVPKVIVPDVPNVCWAFNSSYQDLKDRFYKYVTSNIQGIHFWAYTASMTWVKACEFISRATCFIGCKSSNYVLAHGVGQENIFVYEPHPNRNAYGPFGKVFSNPHWKETNIDLNKTPEQAGEIAVAYIKQCVMEKLNENAQTITR